MGTIPSDVRSGLLELFYGVYQKDPDRCIDALIAMGVLVPGGDRLAIRRTAEFFLNNFQVRKFALLRLYCGAPVSVQLAWRMRRSALGLRPVFQSGCRLSKATFCRSVWISKELRPLQTQWSTTAISKDSHRRKRRRQSGSRSWLQ